MNEATPTTKATPTTQAPILTNEPRTADEVHVMFSNYLKVRGISQAAFADEIGVDPSTVGSWARGFRLPPSWAMALIGIQDANRVRKSIMLGHKKPDRKARTQTSLATAFMVTEYETYDPTRLFDHILETYGLRSLRELASVIGCNASTLSNIASKRESVSPAIMVRLYDTLGMEINEIRAIAGIPLPEKHVLSPVSAEQPDLFPNTFNE